jgi:GNAT superfamily N-acetyltransferase
MNIRPATVEDIPSLLPLTRAFHHAAKLNEYAEWSADKWAAWLRACVEHDSGLCAVAVNGGPYPVGFATAVAVPSYWDPDVVVCQETVLWTVPESRGNGVGTSLIQFIEEWARAKGCRVVAVGTQQHMEPKKTAHRYRELGFELTEKAFAKRL